LGPNTDRKGVDVRLYTLTLIAVCTLSACAAANMASDPEAVQPQNVATAAQDPVPAPAAPGALGFVQERLVGTYTGEWTMFGLDADDKAQAAQNFTDSVTASNPRIENGRAIVDVAATMDMGGGGPPFQLAFIEGVIVGENGARGDYFVELQGNVQMYKEVKPNVWETESPLNPRDYQAMANVTAENVIGGWKRSTKVVSWVDGSERHDITVLTHVEYTNAAGKTITVEFTSMVGFHQKPK